MNGCLGAPSRQLARSILLVLLATEPFGGAVSSIAGQDPTPDTPGARAHHWLVYDETAQCVLLCGGATPVGEAFTFFDDIWSFDGTAWHRAGKLDRPQSGMRVVCRPDSDGLLAFGGYTPGGDILGELRACVDGAWTILDPASDKTCTDGGFVHDRARGRHVLFGGGSKQGKRGTTWEWNGTEWQAFDVPGPEARLSHGMVYDERRGRVVLFGGQGKTRLGDTWEWDGKAWTEVNGAGPVARLAPGMAYDRERGVTVLFGGAGPNGALADTWVYDGAQWRELEIAGPPGRVGPAMAYDQKRAVVVLFGGRASWPNDLADTWIFDGEAWRRVGGGE